MHIIPEENLISTGSDARIYKCMFLGKESAKKMIIPKNYRHKKIDAKIRKLRIMNEIKFTLKMITLNIDSPALYFVDMKEKSLIFEYVKGCTLNQILKKIKSYQSVISISIGMLLANIHNENIIHGDFTTSNLILRNSYIHNNEIYDSSNNELYNLSTPDKVKLCLIDFGLSFLSASVEDKAVDIFVLLKTINSFHSEFPLLERDIMNGYQMASNDFTKISQQLEKVKLRGRKRSMVG